MGPDSAIQLAFTLPLHTLRRNIGLFAYFPFVLWSQAYLLPFPLVMLYLPSDPNPYYMYSCTILVNSPPVIIYVPSPPVYDVQVTLIVVGRNCRCTLDEPYIVIPHPSTSPVHETRRTRSHIPFLPFPYFSLFFRTHSQSPQTKFPCPPSSAATQGLDPTYLSNHCTDLDDIGTVGNASLRSVRIRD